MIDKKKMAIVACGVFVLIGLAVNGIVGIRNLDRDNENKEVFSRDVSCKTSDGATQSYVFENVFRRDIPFGEDTENTAASRKNEVGYILKIFNGNIAVYLEDDMDYPIRITDIPEHTLRVYDREQLISGISVKGEKGLSLALEDFGS